MIARPTKTPSPNQVSRDYALFAEKFLKIQTIENGQLVTVPLVYNWFQLDYLSKRTPRDLILKPRQLGFTTCIQGEFRRYEWTRPTRSLTLGKDDENTTDLRAMADFFYDHLPQDFRPIRSINNSSRTEYPDVKSRATIRKAGNRNSGRGGTNTRIHLSEVAFYPDAGSIVASALQAGNPLWVAAESTANGADESNWFFSECMAALRGESVWTLHFYRWFDNPAYAIPLELKEVLVYDDEEKELVRLHGLKPEQIKWRRFKQLELRISGTFLQEYPEDVLTCFLQSGNGVFSFLVDTFTAPNEAIYDETHQYVMGIDWGQSDDFTDARVFDVTDYCEVAHLHINKQSYESMINEIAKLAYAWHVEKIVPERNSMGAAIEMLSAALNALDWPIDKRTGYPSNPTIQSFWTDIRSKDRVVKLFQAGIEAGLKLLPDPIANQELRAFISKQQPSGLWSYDHPIGGKSDTVIARLLAHAATYELKA
jgi:hypothetical protein